MIICKNTILKISPKNIPNSNNFMKKSAKVCRNDVWNLFEINLDKPFIDHLSGTTKTLLGHLCLDTLLANLFLGALLRNSCLASLGTCSSKPVPGNLFLDTYPWKPCMGTLLVNLLFGTLLRNLFLRMFGNFGNLFLGTLLGNLAWEILGTSSWGTSSWGTLLGNHWEPLAWEALAGNLGTLRCGILAAPTCSGTFTMAASLRCWGKIRTTRELLSMSIASDMCKLINCFGLPIAISKSPDT